MATGNPTGLHRMAHRTATIAFVAGGLAACGGPPVTPMPTKTGGQYVAGFNPSDAPAGYVRFVTPTVKGIKPGDDLTYCQWLADASTTDIDVASVIGNQSRSGHHASLYATKVREAVGTSRLCTDQDMLSVTFLGAVGGEGVSSGALTLPDGVVFRLPPGQMLMGNIHYLNASSDTFDGQSVIDVKFQPPQTGTIQAALFASSYDAFAIPAGAADYVADVSCVADRQMSLFLYGNHMHHYGRRMLSEVVRLDGTRVLLAQDDTWSDDKTFNTAWTHWTKASPMVINKGDRIHQRCTWSNATANDVRFPTEMCVGTGFVLEGGEQVVCNAQ